jgi:hypothetical protein
VEDIWRFVSFKLEFLDYSGGEVDCRASLAMTVFSRKIFHHTPSLQGQRGNDSV